MLGHKCLFDHAMTKVQTAPAKPPRVCDKDALEGKISRPEGMVVSH